jgi:hypothetical protein
MYIHMRVHFVCTLTGKARHCTIRADNGRQTGQKGFRRTLQTQTETVSFSRFERIGKNARYAVTA